MTDNSHRFALIIGASKYKDPTLSQLKSPEADVITLASVLSDPKLGNFQVSTAINQPINELRRQIALFFRNKSKDDLLLLYFSGHGIRDDEGNLFLATSDTERDFVDFTAIPAREITNLMDRGMSKRNVLMLDCCYSGAFATGAKSALGSSIGTKNFFEGNGYGRIVLTATDSLQYAWDGNSVLGELPNSVFTHFLIDGIKSGDADLNQDGFITVDELYEFVYEKIVRSSVKQTPSKWSYKEQGEMLISLGTKKIIIKLPPDIEYALNSSYPPVRLGAVYALETICRNNNELSEIAKKKLEALRNDTNSDVANFAANALISLQKRETNIDTLSVRDSLEKQSRPAIDVIDKQTPKIDTLPKEPQATEKNLDLALETTFQNLATKKEKAILLATIQKPSENLLRQINAPAMGLLYVLQAYIAKKSSETHPNHRKPTPRSQKPSR
jgi:hypothetical protein